ncbi:hypothetical protein STANM309S_02615 [Streptomyces tanashiensis]
MRLVDALAEEDQLEAAAAVGDGHFEALAAPLGAVEGVHTGVGDLRDHRDVLVERQVGERGQLPALGVPAGVVVEQVPDRVQVECLGHDLGGGGAEGLLEWFVERGHAFH